MTHREEPDAYVVRWSARLLTLPILLLVAVGVLLTVAWPPSLLTSALAAILLVLDGVVWVRTVSGIVRRRMLFAVDSRGVYLGGDGDPRPPEWVPWQAIDAVVRFRRWTRTADGRATAQWHVGIAQGGRIITDRPVRGWTLDVDRLTAATHRLGDGRSVRLTADQGATSDAGGSYETYVAPPPGDPGAADAYVVRLGPRALLIPAVILVVVAVVAVIAWPPPILLWVAIALLLAGAVVLSVRTVRQLVNRTVVFAVDARGVYLGPDDHVVTPEWIPWTGVDAVVRYRWRTTTSRGGTAARWHVGVMRGGKIVADRRAQDWRLDVDQLSAATRRYGNGRRVEHLPDQGASPHTISFQVRGR